MDKSDISHIETLADEDNGPAHVKLFRTSGEDVVLIPTPSLDPRGSFYPPVTVPLLTSKKTP